MEIRLAGLADAKVLGEIEQQCFVTDQIPPRQMRYLLSKAKAKTWVLETDNGLAGYCMVLLPTHPRAARLYSIAVLPEYRGQNIASQLMEALLSEVKQQGYRRIRLEVRASQHKIHALYQKFGFTTINELQGYYADGESALKMECYL